MRRLLIRGLGEPCSTPFTFEKLESMTLIVIISLNNIYMQNNGMFIPKTDVIIFKEILYML